MPNITGYLTNFAPVAAIALCGPVIFPQQLALVLPLATLFASDVVLNLHFVAALLTWEMLARYVALGAIALAGSAGFYLLTNSVSWWSEPAHARTVGGWWQAMTVGLPAYPPTWLFFRNSLAADICFTFAVLLCIAWANRKRPALRTAFTQEQLSIVP